MTRPVAFHIMTKPIGPICNLDCRYCFYLEKERLYPDNERFRMTDDVLERYIRDYIAAQQVPEVSFAWQGGEPTLLGVKFFRRVVELQAKYADDRKITNAFQTNGTLLDDEWGAFFAEHGFLIGLSIDGPRELHDTYRVTKKGAPTFDAVMSGLGFLQKHKADYNTLTVVNDLNSRHPLEVYRFMKEIGSQFLQFIPLVERLPGTKETVLDLARPPGPGERAERAPVTDWSVRPVVYGDFLSAIFDEWVRRDVGKVFVQIFDVSLASWMELPPPLCVFSETCGTALALEHNGDLYSCDHYVYPQHRLGNLVDQALGDLVASPQQVKFGADKRDSLPKYCRECDVRFACNGECPKHRFLSAPDGEPGLNYLCAGYKRFFHHIDVPMKTMAALLAARRAPAEIMGMLASRDEETKWETANRNGPCPCGSGKKYKQCCAISRGGRSK